MKLWTIDPSIPPVLGVEIPRWNANIETALRIQAQYELITDKNRVVAAPGTNSFAVAILFGTKEDMPDETNSEGLALVRVYETGGHAPRGKQRTYLGVVQMDVTSMLALHNGRRFYFMDVIAEA